MGDVVVKLIDAIGNLITIMLPGMMAVLLALFVTDNLSLMGIDFADGAVSSGENVGATLALLGASFVAGHFCYMIGSMLDRIVDGAVRDATRLGFLRVLSTGQTPDFDGPGARVARLMYGKDPDRSVSAAERLKALALEPVSEATNTYKWAKALLLRENPEAHAIVVRLERDYKFFRSFVVISSMAVVTFA